MSISKRVKVKVILDRSEIRKTMKKLRRLRRILKEANSLADELASQNIKITISM